MDGGRTAVRVRPWLRRTARTVLPILVLVGAWQIWDNSERRRIEPLRARVEASIRKSETGGLPPGKQPWLQADDAWRFYAAAITIAQLETTPPGAGDLLMARRAAVMGGAEERADVAEAAARAVVANEWPLRLIDYAAGLPLRYARQGRSSGGFQISQLVDLCRAAALRTLEEVERGDQSAAVDLLITRARLHRTFGPDRWGGALLLGGTEARGLATDVGIVLSHAPPSTAELKRLDAALADVLDPNTISNAIAEVGLFRTDLVRSVTRDSAVAGARPLLLRMARASLLTSVQGLEAAAQPWPARISAARRLTDNRPLIRWGAPAGVYQVAETIRAIVLSTAEREAVIHAARVAVALEVRRASEGTLPESLDVLGSQEVVMDPFTGDPLKYTRIDGGYVIYSVGRDERDDGGKLDPEPKSGVPLTNAMPPDIGVRVVYRRAASMSPSNNGLNSPVR